MSERERGKSKVVLNIDDTLLRRLHDEAARQRTAVSALLEAGLRRGLAERVPADAGSDALKPLPTWRGGEPRVDIADRDALYRLMEEE